jgi:hypothetical protein
MADAEGHREFISAYNRGGAPTLLQTAYVLLTEPRKLRQLLLGRTLLLPDPLDVPTDQLAHVHAPEVSG